MKKMMNSQQKICKRLNASFSPCGINEKLGIAIETLGKNPINGLRHIAENGTCGWNIWCGEELSEEADFFHPLHISHISEYLPKIEKYLALPPGFRFLIDSNGYEDIWFDSNLLEERP